MKTFSVVLLLLICAWLAFSLLRPPHQRSDSDTPPAASPFLANIPEAEREPRLSIGAEGLADFFSQAGKPALLFIYRTDCQACGRAEDLLRNHASDTDILAASMDDRPGAYRASMAAMREAFGTLPYYIPPRRVLAVRTYLSDPSCRFDGTLPYVALSDGNGRCLKAWRGEISERELSEALSAEAGVAAAR